MVLWLDSGGVAEPYRILTSGSTGEPKTVRLSRLALLASARAAHERLGGPGQWLLALDESRVAGLGVIVRSVLAGIEPVFLDEHEDLDSAIQAMTHERRYISLVPTQLHRLMKEGKSEALRSFSAVLIGGSSISPRLVSAAHEAGIPIVRTYGMTETCGGCVYDGRPLDGVEIALDANDRIKIKGPVLFDGYGDEDFVQEWFLTQDVGYFDAGGELHIIGRIDDVVKSGAEKVALPAVGHALKDIAGVIDAEAFSVTDEEWGNKIVAAIVGDVSLDVIRQSMIAAGLPKAWIPKEVMSVDHIPQLRSGKPDRLSLAARFAK